MRTAVFLDRDGVIIENRPDHVKSWSEVRFLPAVFPAMHKLALSQAAIVVISNQSAVGRGLITFDAAWNLQQRIVEEIEKHGGRIDASYICPHHPDDKCDCRKPAPGMILQAARELDLDLAKSWFVGDAVSDLEAAKAAGIKAILVQTGRGSDQEKIMPANDSRRWPVVADLSAAVKYIFT
ncbi:MAG: D-glycero-alpha-D-manno-heptose-1,7-bisphosphate 7-phosphatase [Thermoguttaceae bacterium]